MERPSIIRLLGVSIKIEYCNFNDEESNNEDVYGEWHSDTFDIKIEENLPPHHQKITLLHELLHGVDDFLSLGISHKSVYAISQCLYAVMRENREMIEWVMED